MEVKMLSACEGRGLVRKDTRNFLGGSYMGSSSSWTLKICALYCTYIIPQFKNKEFQPHPFLLSDNVILGQWLHLSESQFPPSVKEDGKPCIMGLWEFDEIITVSAGAWHSVGARQWGPMLIWSSGAQPGPRTGQQHRKGLASARGCDWCV